MANLTVAKGQKVVRVKGDYVVGSVGEIIDVLEDNKVQVKWQFGPKTKVNVDCIEDFRPFTINIVRGRTKNKKVVVFD